MRNSVSLFPRARKSCYFFAAQSQNGKKDKSRRRKMQIDRVGCMRVVAIDARCAIAAPQFSRLHPASALFCSDAHKTLRVAFIPGARCKHSASHTTHLFKSYNLRHVAFLTSICRRFSVKLLFHIKFCLLFTNFDKYANYAIFGAKSGSNGETTRFERC
jgi:hypothetical protein